MDWAAAHSHAAADVHVAMGSDQKKLLTSVEVTLAPVRVPNQQPFVPSFSPVVG